MAVGRLTAVKVEVGLKVVVCEWHHKSASAAYKGGRQNAGRNPLARKDFLMATF